VDLKFHQLLLEQETYNLINIMAHYAFIDQNNIVTEIIVGKNEGEEGINWEQHYGNFRGQTCKRTSYNTKGGVHLLGETPFRKNYAGIGYSYDETRDAFIPPKPFNSWILNENTCLWDSPVAMPIEELEENEYYSWNESIINWDIKTRE
jgi:hypothetical protein